MLSIRDQLETAQIAQQMFQQSEIQRYEAVIHTLVAQIQEHEDEGSEIRIRDLERQRETASQAMRHMNNVNLEMKKDFEDAMSRVSEQSHAQRQRDHNIAEELAQRLHYERTQAAHNIVLLEERAQGEGVGIAKEYEKLTSELHAKASENLRLRAGLAETENATVTMKEHLHIARNEGGYCS